MAIPSSYNIDKKINSFAEMGVLENGGKGSGNFGHAGRPGEVGGSGDGTGQTVEEMKHRLDVVYGELDGIGQAIDDKAEGIDTPIPEDEYIDRLEKEARELEEKIKAKELDYELMLDGRLSKEDRKELVAEGERAYYVIAEKLWDYEMEGNRHRRIGEEKPATRGDRIIASKLGFDTSKFSDVDMMLMSSQEFWESVKHDLGMFKRNQADTYQNGGKGSGNYGHYGRPGQVGGSAPAGARGVARTTAEEIASKTVADMIYDDPKGKYSDGFDNMDRAKEYLVGQAGELEGVGEQIHLAYEDDARDTLGLPTRDEESDGADMSYGELAELGSYIEETIRSKSFEDLEKDLGRGTIEMAVDCAMRQGGLEYALGNSKLGQAGLSHNDSVRDLKSFMADFGISDHYGAVKSAESGDFRTAWRSIAYDLSDNIDSEYGRQYGRDYFERIDK